jgi:aminopeptidase N
MRGFAELEDERAIPLVLSWTEYGKPPFARDAAIRALGKLGHGNAKVRARLVDLLNDKNFYARLAAVSALQLLHEPEAIEVLNRLAAQDVDGRLKSAAAKAARAIGDYLEKPLEFKALRGEIESLRESNKSLLDRLERLEAKTKSKK